LQHVLFFFSSSFFSSLVCGDVERKFKTLFSRVESINKGHVSFNLLLCVGMFFGGTDEGLEPYRYGTLTGNIIVIVSQVHWACSWEQLFQHVIVPMCSIKKSTEIKDLPDRHNVVLSKMKAQA
jgi:hypothetical protein